MNKDLIKKIFIAIAYIAYIMSIIIQNHLHIDLTYYNYVIAAIIGISLKIAQNVEIVEKIILTMPENDLDFIKERLNSIAESQTGSQTHRTERSVIVDIPNNAVNEPITPSSGESTHRDIELSNGNIVRIHKK